MSCPVCKASYFILEQQGYGIAPVRRPALLYQRSYPGEPEYISPRCDRCFDREYRRRLSKERLKDG
jgi:transposase-like protein